MDLVSLDPLFVDQRDWFPEKKQFRAGKTSLDPFVAVRVRPVFNLCPLQKGICGVTELAYHDPACRSPSLHQCQPMFCLNSLCPTLVLCGGGQVCRSAVLLSVHFEAVAPPAVPLSECHQSSPAPWFLAIRLRDLSGTKFAARP